ncbi:MAG: CDP-diacylglycerol diphosphatase [Ancalomicrobiaceae bacterium]|nr:CDP-diacylglycerol diphosphatase [Ancalomicrobiaceae bacterium]
MGRCLPLAIASLVAALATTPAAAEGPLEVERQTFGSDDLWRVVSYLCVPSAAIGLPLPCAEVKGAGANGIALLAVSDNHILTIPTRRISGIESPELQRPNLPNYWQAAWDARRLISAGEALRLDRSQIGVALNSARDRSQDQLHFHTGCLGRTARTLIGSLPPDPGGGWRRVAKPLFGGRYRIRWIAGEDLSATDVFGLLEPSLRASPAAMGRQTLVVAGVRLPGGTPGFAVLNAQGARPGEAHGENLLDFSCRS